MSRTPLFALVLILALGLLAPATLADDEPGAPAPAKPKEDEQPKVDDGEKKGEGTDEAKKAEPVITIVEAGAEPKVLRFKPTCGSKITTTARLVIGFNMGGMGGAMDIAVVADMTIDKGSQDGQFSVAGKLTKCEMAEDPNNPMAAQLKPMIDSLKGVSFKGEYSERGKWVDHPASNLEGVPEQSAQFGQMVAMVFSGIMVEVPAGAVGTGGSWTDERDVTVRGSRMKSRAVYKVEKVSGDRVTLSYTDKREGKNSKISMMGMEVTVVKSTGEGSGTLTLDLALGVATAGTLKMKNVQETDSMGNIESTTDGTQETKKAATAVTTGGTGEK